jgi:methionyl aminopeptidase
MFGSKWKKSRSTKARVGKMISKKSREEIKLMKYAGNVVAVVHQAIKNAVVAGVSTFELDEIAYNIIKENKCTPTFKGYRGFPASICASVNEQVVHGIPSKDMVLKEGDVIAIDVGATYKGLIADSAWTYPVGKVSAEVENLLATTEKSLWAGISAMKNGAKLDDVSGAIEDVLVAQKLGIVRQYGGHGVGRSLHEEPFVFNWRTGKNLVLKPGMTIAIEPMANLGCDEVFTLDDDWTVVTKDSKFSAHFEHTILVTQNEPEIITKAS